MDCKKLQKEKTNQIELDLLHLIRLKKNKKLCRQDHLVKKSKNQSLIKMLHLKETRKRTLSQPTKMPLTKTPPTTRKIQVKLTQSLIKIFQITSTPKERNELSYQVKSKKWLKLSNSKEKHQLISVVSIKRLNMGKET